jgi:hypothetical protein
VRFRVSPGLQRASYPNVEENGLDPFHVWFQVPPRSLKSVKDYDEVEKLYNNGLRPMDISRKLNIKKNSIYSAINRIKNK